MQQMMAAPVGNRDSRNTNRHQDERTSLHRGSIVNTAGAGHRTRHSLVLRFLETLQQPNDERTKELRAKEGKWKPNIDSLKRNSTVQVNSQGDYCCQAARASHSGNKQPLIGCHLPQVVSILAVAFGNLLESRKQGQQ